GEDRTWFGRIRVEIIGLDGSRQPAVRIVEEGLQVRPAMRLTGFAGLVVFGYRHSGVIDRPEIAHEARPGDAQLHLKIAPRLIGLLSLENRAHRVTDRDQLPDDVDLLFREADSGTALADRN